MNKKYFIKITDNVYLSSHLSHLSMSILESFLDSRISFNNKLKEFGLKQNDSNYHLYEVIDEQLFSLFLLEYSDQIKIEELYKKLRSNRILIKHKNI